MLVALGFGSTLAVSGCGVNRASKSRTPAEEPEPAKKDECAPEPVFDSDTVIMRVMYGVPNRPFVVRPEVADDGTVSGEKTSGNDISAPAKE